MPSTLGSDPVKHGGVTKEIGVPGAAERNADLRLKAWDLRAQHLTFREIGEKLGISHAHAHRLVTEYWTEIEPITKEKAEAYRERELQTLGELEQRWKPIAMAESLDVSKIKEGANGPIHIEIPEYEAGTKAAAIVLKIQERRASMLGIDAPKKMEHSGELTVKHLTLEEYRKRIAESKE